METCISYMNTSDNYSYMLLRIGSVIALIMQATQKPIHRPFSYQNMRLVVAALVSSAMACGAAPNPEQTDHVPEDKSPASDSSGVATAHLVSWTQDLTGTPTNFLERASLRATVDTLPTPGLEAYWTPIAGIELNFEQFDASTNAPKTTSIIPLQLATVANVTAEGFSLIAADGTTVRVEKESALVTTIGPVAQAALAELATYALSPQATSIWGASMAYPFYYNEMLLPETYAHLSADVFDKIPQPAEPSYGEGTFQKVQTLGGVTVQCIQDTLASTTTCFLSTSASSITHVGTCNVNAYVALTGDDAAILKSILLGGEAASAHYEGIAVACGASECTLQWATSRRDLCYGERGCSLAWLNDECL